MLGFDAMALLSRVLRLGDGNSEPGRDTYQFFSRHAVSWDKTSSWNASIPRIWDNLRELGIFQLVFWMRSFAPDIGSAKGPLTTAQSGLRCERESGKLSLCGTVLSFVERRYSVAGRVNTRGGGTRLYPYGVCAIISIRDPGPDKSNSSTRGFAWTAIRDQLAPCAYYSGIVELLKALCTALDAWCVFSLL